MNRGRRNREFRRAYGSAERVRFLNDHLGCQVPGCRTWGEAVHNAHIERAGKGRKADYDKIVPLCATHHRELDEKLGRERFERVYGIDLAAAAARVDEVWREWGDEGLDE